MHSIRVKITAITIAAILTSILSVIGAIFLTIETGNDRTSAEMLNLVSQNTQKKLDDYLESIQQSVEMAANIAADSLDSIALVEGGIAGTYAQTVDRTPEQEIRLDAYLADHCEKVKEAFSSVANHTQGVVTYYYCISTEASRNVHGFFYSKVGKTGFEEQPPLIAEELDPNDLAHTTWYYTPIKRGRPSWVGPYTAHFLGEEWTLSYLVPIYKCGTLIGVLGMDLFSDTLIEQIEPIKVYQTGFACLLDADGNVLYHPEMEAGTTPELSFITSNKEIFLQDSSGNELIRYSNGKQIRQMSFSTLSSGMKLVVTAPVDEINAAWTNLTRFILFITIIIIAVFTVIILIVMGVLTRPLKRLTAASQELAEGDYDVSLDYRGKDEVGTLTKAFSKMRDHQKEYIEDLNRRLITDEMTGLPNMKHFLVLAEAARAEMAEEGKQSAFLFFNLIGIKFFNRQYGFEQGNELICCFARILANHYGMNRSGRFGGDHFAVITEEDRIEEELRIVFEELKNTNNGVSLPVRTGIYADRLGDVSASGACDRAKFAADLHRDSYESAFYYFDNTMLDSIQTYHYIVTNLEKALQRKWIHVYYQPIVRAVNGKVSDEEALARWIDPVSGFYSPADFIPVLETSRLIYKLDLYVLDRIIEKMKEKLRTKAFIVPHSINLSRVDFECCDMVSEIITRIDAAGIPHDKFSIEITESAVGQDMEFIKKQTTRLQENGFKVWMDDFGSGYSSLDVLQNIRFDLIKLDMRFLQSFEKGDASKIILTEMIKMASGLGIETIAEGVETKEEVEFLKKAGCTKLQGYYFGKPVPLEEIEDERFGVEN